MSAQAKKLGVEQRANIETVTVPIKLTYKTNTTDATMRLICDIPEALGYTEEDGQSAPSDAGFPTLDDDAAPGVTGFYLSCGDALELVSATVDAGSIYATGGTAATAVVVTREGDVAAKPGITATKNISLSMSWTTLDPDAQIQDNSCWLLLTYVRNMSV